MQLKVFFIHSRDRIDGDEDVIENIDLMVTSGGRRVQALSANSSNLDLSTGMCSSSSSHAPATTHGG